jgi:DNA invertase Pin-like site-specific DNA recombinase
VAHGWSIAEVYEDQISGGKASRPALDKLLADARARRFDVVCVYKLDRFGRSLQNCLTHLRTLEAHGIRFLASTQGIDTNRADPAGRFLLHILAAAAEFEREYDSRGDGGDAGGQAPRQGVGAAEGCISPG